MSYNLHALMMYAQGREKRTSQNEYRREDYIEERVALTNED